jgi:hypothetical protein
MVFHFLKDLNVALLPLRQIGKQLADLGIMVHPRGPAVEPGGVALHLLGDFQDFRNGQFASHRSYIQDQGLSVQICGSPSARVKCR